MISSHKSKKRSPLQAYQFLPNKQIMFCAFLILLLLYSNQNDSHVSVHLFTIYLLTCIYANKKKKWCRFRGHCGTFFSVIDFGKNFVGMQKLLRSTHKIIWRISTLIKIQTILKLFIHRLPGARGDEIVKICLMK